MDVIFVLTTTKGTLANNVQIIFFMMGAVVLHGCVRFHYGVFLVMFPPRVLVGGYSWPSILQFSFYLFFFDIDPHHSWGFLWYTVPVKLTNSTSPQMHLIKSILSQVDLPNSKCFNAA